MKSETGWIKIYRSLIDWEWYHDTNVTRLFLHLLLTVNYEDKKWQGTLIKRGEIITSYASLAEQTSLSTQQVRTALNKLISTGDITKKSTNKYQRLTVCNYNTYQERFGSEQQTSNNQITNNQQQLKKLRSKEYKNNYVQFVDLWNETYGTKLRITDGKRTQIKARLESFTEDEIKLAIANRSKDSFLNGEGKKYLTSWNSFWRNDEKIERYLNKEQPKKTNYIAI